MEKDHRLTPEEMVELRRWRPPFLEFPVHKVLEHQFGLCIRGIEDAIVIGPRGTGKTKSVVRACQDVRSTEAERVIEESSYMPREVVYYEACKADGAKTALLDLYREIFHGGSPISARSQSPHSLREHIADEAVRRNIRLVCVDEAQLISSENLDMLRQVPDALRARGHMAGLMLVGSEELRDRLRKIKQLGQRFSGEVVFPRADRKTVAPHLTGFHPHLPSLQKSLKAGEWGALEAEIFRAANGSMRRFMRIIENAHELVLRWERRLDAKLVRMAIQKLAAED